MENSAAFNNYGNYYDLFYNDKDYQLESEYLIKLFESQDKNIKKILELGSGSGNYSTTLSNKGYLIKGVELSATMIEKSLKKKIKNFEAIQGDIKSFDLHDTFDAAFSFFDVMCYLNTNKEIISSLKCINQHLKIGGTFIFDSWHTAGVYSSLPSTRVKQAENDEVFIVRIATPTIHYNTNIVDVSYEFILRDKKTDKQSLWKEKHSLRHFSIPEIQLFCEVAGFKHIRSEEMLTGNIPNENSWKTCHILQKL